MWRLALAFGVGVAVGAVGATYAAGFQEGQREALRAANSEAGEREEDNSTEALPSQA